MFLLFFRGAGRPQGSLLFPFCNSDLDDSRAYLDRSLCSLPGRDDCLRVALAQRAQDEEAGDARLSGASGHDLKTLGIALQIKVLKVLVVKRDPAPPKDNLAGNDPAVVESHPFEGLLAEKLFRPALDPTDALIIEELRVLRGQCESLAEKGHVPGKHLLHADAKAHAVDGAVDYEQFSPRRAITVANHAGEVGGAEEARQVLKGSDRLPGPGGSDDIPGAVGLPPSLHVEASLPSSDTLHPGALHADAKALCLGEACFQEVSARHNADAEVVLDMLGMVGPSAGTVKEQDAEVVAAKVDAGLQASRPSTDNNAVEEFPAFYFVCSFHYSALSIDSYESRTFPFPNVLVFVSLREIFSLIPSNIVFPFPMATGFSNI